MYGKNCKVKTPEEKLALKVSFYTIIVNILLSIGKLIAGIVAHSGAMVSDAIHSASDVISTILVMVGIRLSNREADLNHHYGHERVECVFSIILAMILLLTGLGIGLHAIEKISGIEEVVMPGFLALFAAGLSIVIKEGMYWYTITVANKLDSTALRASAWDHRSDAFSSIGSFAGIFGARMGYPRLDAVASLLICILIIKAAIDIFLEAINRMVDKACDSQTEEEMRAVILRQPGVQKIDVLRTRIFGAKIYADVEISVEGVLTLIEAHQIAEDVHKGIENAFPNVKHCMVHVNPYEE